MRNYETHTETIENKERKNMKFQVDICCTYNCSLSSVLKVSTNTLITALTCLSRPGSLQAPALTVTQAVSTVAFLQWSQVKAASHYNLVVRKQGHPQVDSEAAELTVYGEEVILDDLEPNSIYCVTVSAQNASASGPESHPVCILTGQEQKDF